MQRNNINNKTYKQEEFQRAKLRPIYQSDLQQKL